MFINGEHLIFHSFKFLCAIVHTYVWKDTRFLCNDVYVILAACQTAGQQPQPQQDYTAQWAEYHCQLGYSYPYQQQQQQQQPGQDLVQQMPPPGAMGQQMPMQQQMQQIYTSWHATSAHQE